MSWSLRMSYSELVECAYDILCTSQKYLSDYQYECYIISIQQQPLLRELLLRFPLFPPAWNRVINNTILRYRLQGHQPHQIHDPIYHHTREKTREWLKNRYPIMHAPSFSEGLDLLAHQLSSNTFDHLLLRNESERVTERAREGVGAAKFRLHDSLTQMKKDFFHYFDFLKKSEKSGVSFGINEFRSMISWAIQSENPQESWTIIISCMDANRTAYHTSPDKLYPGFDYSCPQGFEERILDDMLHFYYQTHPYHPTPFEISVSRMLDPFLSLNQSHQTICSQKLYDTYLAASGCQIVTQNISQYVRKEDIPLSHYQRCLNSYRETKKLEFLEKIEKYSTQSHLEKIRLSYQPWVLKNTTLSEKVATLPAQLALIPEDELRAFLDDEFQKKLTTIENISAENQYLWSQCDLDLDLPSLFCVQQIVRKSIKRPDKSIPIKTILEKMQEQLQLSFEHLLIILNILGQNQYTNPKNLYGIALMDSLARDGQVYPYEWNPLKYQPAEFYQSLFDVFTQKKSPILELIPAPQNFSNYFDVIRPFLLDTKNVLERSEQQFGYAYEYMPCSDRAFSQMLTDIASSHSRSYLLRDCIRLGYAKSVEILLAGVSLSDLKSLRQLVIQSGHAALLMIFESYAQKIEQQTFPLFDETHFEMACSQYGRLEIAQALFSKGIFTHLSLTLENTLKSAACSLDVIEFLISHGALLTKTSFADLISRGNVAIFQMCQKAHNFKTIFDALENPYHYALYHKQPQIFDDLMRLYPGDSDQYLYRPDFSNLTSLHYLVMNGDAIRLKQLLDRARPDIIQCISNIRCDFFKHFNSDRRCSLFFLAVTLNQVECVRVLIDYPGVELDQHARDSLYQNTPFLEACQKGYLQMVQILIGHSDLINIHAVNQARQNALELAFFNKKDDMLEFFIDQNLYHPFEHHAPDILYRYDHSPSRAWLMELECGDLSQFSFLEWLIVHRKYRYFFQLLESDVVQQSNSVQKALRLFLEKMQKQEDLVDVTFSDILFALKNVNLQVYDFFECLYDPKSCQLFCDRVTNTHDFLEILPLLSQSTLGFLRGCYSFYRESQYDRFLNAFIDRDQLVSLVHSASDVMEIYHVLNQNQKKIFLQKLWYAPHFLSHFQSVEDFLSVSKIFPQREQQILIQYVFYELQIQIPPFLSQEFMDILTMMSDRQRNEILELRLQHIQHDMTEYPTNILLKLADILSSCSVELHQKIWKALMYNSDRLQCNSFEDYRRIFHNKRIPEFFIEKIQKNQFSHYVQKILSENAVSSKETLMTVLEIIHHVNPSIQSKLLHPFIQKYLIQNNEIPTQYMHQISKYLSLQEQQDLYSQFHETGILTGCFYSFRCPVQNQPSSLKMFFSKK